MGKVKRGAGRLWGCLASIASLISGLVVGFYLFYKPSKVEDKNGLDRAVEVAYSIACGCALCIVSWMGGWSDLAGALVVVVVADYVAGFAAACFHRSRKTRDGGLSSRVGFYGIMKKVMSFMAIIVAHQVDVVVGQGGSAIRDIVTGCLVANECRSFYENIALFGIPFPKKLRRILDQLREPEDNVQDKNDNTKGSGTNG